MRSFLLAALTLLLGLGGSALAADPVTGPGAAGPTDHVLGRADAPITIVEYASLTCPHCAAFSRDVFPKIQAAYIDTGKAKWVYRDFPLDELAVRASMLARCLPAERYFPFIETLFKTQASWAYVKEPMPALARTAKLAGLGQADIDACLANKSIEDAVLGSRLEADKDFKVDSTPSFIINGAKASPGATFESFDALLKPLVP